MSSQQKCERCVLIQKKNVFKETRSFLGVCMLLFGYLNKATSSTDKILELTGYQSNSLAFF